MFKGIVKKVFGDPLERAIAQYRETVDKINALEDAMQKFSDEDLRAKTSEFKQRLEQGETLNDILVEAYAVVRETSVRTTGLRPYDVQIIGGIVLHEGRIAEMKTGEGKTLVATLPIYLNALSGKGVHLVTPNDYLSKVGLQTMGGIYHFLGLSAAVIQNSGGQGPDTASYIYDPDYNSDDARYQNLRPITRREAYHADITYGTNNEFGFDYLRDNMTWASDRLGQRELNFAIIDEVDNILIDEARTPLIISGPADEPSENYRRFSDIVRRLKPSSQASVDDDEMEPDGDYVVDIQDRIVYLTEKGVEKVQRTIGTDELYSPENSELLPYLDNCLRAHALFVRDKDYVVDKGQVVIVDEFTGRMMYGRRFSEGLHQGIEAKENLEIRRENVTMATVTFQNFFRMYEKLAGMTGTAVTEAEEFEKIYNLSVQVIPTNLPVIRDDKEDLIYVNEKAKWKAIVDEIKWRQENNQPVLVGTVAIETSERLSSYLTKANVSHEVLNAKQHEREADIIAQAGRPGAVTIATNMAGRGVDILLGGNPDGTARSKLRRQGIDVTEVTPEQWDKIYAEAITECQQGRKDVLKAGGLYVLGTERHEARRIDNQLRGRSGRQGDPGETRFYLSLDDDLVVRFGGERVRNVMNMMNLPEDEPIEHGMISKAIAQAQIRVEGHNFDIRKKVVEYDDVVNRQREIIYEQRQEWLFKEKDELVADYVALIAERIETVLKEFFGEETQFALDEDEAEALYPRLLVTFPVPTHITTDWIVGKPFEELKAELTKLAQDSLHMKIQELEATQEGLTERALRVTILRAIDNHWQRHLTDLDMLREGIGLVSIAQRDPVVEYQRSAFAMFNDLQEGINAQATTDVFRLQVSLAQQQPVRRQMRAIHPSANGGGEAVKQETVRKTHDLGRNDKCWCGSGKKYKHCHLKKDRAKQKA